MQPSKIPFSQSFLAKKKIILNQLSVPISEYDDLSPKGSIDVDIRELIDEINQLEGCVTTSSCSGRISVFLEGKKEDDWVRLGGQVGEGKESGESSSRQYEAQVVENGRGGGKTTAGVGGKGGGGRWLFVTHNAVDIGQHECAGGLQKLLGMEDQYDGQPHGGGKRFIHFKFEPMILHILTASLEQAQIILSAALQAGFRESGAVNLTSSNREAPTPMVAVRSMGLALESLIGFHADGRQVCTVSEESLRTLLEISNDRFRVNRNRIARFRELLIQLSAIDARPMGRDGGKEWEDAEMRKERKKAEGLRRKEMMKNTSDDHVVDPEDIVSLEFFP